MFIFLTLKIKVTNLYLLKTKITLFNIFRDQNDCLFVMRVAQRNSDGMEITKRSFYYLLTILFLRDSDVIDVTTHLVLIQNDRGNTCPHRHGSSLIQSQNPDPLSFLVLNIRVKPVNS